MGIKDLLTIIEKNKAFDMVDLVDEAKNRGSIEILVDFNAIMRFITENFIKKISKDFENDYLFFPIGVYDIFADAMCHLQKGFKDVNIELVWIVDGPKNIDAEASEQKKITWKKRQLEVEKKMDKVLEACENNERLGEDLNNLGPIAYFETAISALKKAGAKVINLLQGESDDFIANEFHRRKSFAIFTNDTDFCVFKDCVVIFQQLLSVGYGKDNLNLPFFDNDNPGKVFRQPESLRIPVVKQSHVLKHLNFSNYDQMIALTLFHGSDHTYDLAYQLKKLFGIINQQNKKPKVIEVANFIRSSSITAENIENNNKIKTFLAKNPQFKEVINFTRDTYTLKRIQENLEHGVVVYDTSTVDDSLTGFFAKKLSNGETSKDMFSIHFGIYRDFINPEKPTDECPPIQTLLSEIRNRIYPHVLEENRTIVVEERSRVERSVESVQVTHVSFKTHMIKAMPNEDDQYSLEKYGIDFFEEVFSHQEDNGSLDYVKKFGVEEAFVCYVLRYLYRLTKGKNLRVTEKEFRALFVTVFYQFFLPTESNRNKFLRMKICPSERCMIIATWFMNICFTAKYLCGGAFNLVKIFPDFSQIMSGPVFYGFYENLMSENGRCNDLMEFVGELEKDIMDKYEMEYTTITGI